MHKSVRSTVYNSAMTSRTIVELAGTQEYPFIETVNIINDRNQLIGDASAQLARNSFNADIVVLLTNGSYNSFGIAGAVEPDNNNSYAIVQATAATGNRRSFVHEVGHLYGCRHQDDATGQPYAHGHIFMRDIFTRCFTMMVQGDVITGSRSRLLNFSNPNVSISGTPTGTVGNNNNARRITETYTTLMAFRPSPFRQFGSYIAGPTQGQAYTTLYTWEAAVTCGIAPFTYEWRTSTDGINFSSVRGASDRFADRLPCPAGNQYYVRLSVRSSDGQVSTNTAMVLIDKSTCQSNVFKANVNYLEPKKSIEDYIGVFPNPADKQSTLQLNLISPKFVLIQIVDARGRLVKDLINKSLPAGKHSKTLAGLRPGVYFIRTNIQNKANTRFVIK